jgi:hypothetical protein
MHVRRLVPLLVAAAVLGGAAARTPILAFDRIQPGAWQLRALGSKDPAQRICIADAYDLIQLRHPSAACSRFVLTNEAGTATVHYTCTGNGYGRTTIKVETPGLIRIESQGLVDRAPFQSTFEARRLGECAVGASAR